MIVATACVRCQTSDPELGSALCKPCDLALRMPLVPSIKGDQGMSITQRRTGARPPTRIAFIREGK